MRGHFNSTETPTSQLLKNITDFCLKGTYVIYNSSDNVVKKKRKCHDKHCTENHGEKDHNHQGKDKNHSANQNNARISNSENVSSITVKNKTKLFSKKIVTTETKVKTKNDMKGTCYTEEYDYDRVEEGGVDDDNDEQDFDEEEEEFLSNTIKYVEDEEVEGRGDRNVNDDDDEHTDNETEGHLLFAYSARHQRIKKEIELNEEHSSIGVAADRKHLLKGSTIGASDR